MNKSISQQGNALIITVIIISTLVTVGLATSRSFMVELKNIRSFLGSEQAFYEAESGLEQGLYKYRSNRRAELANILVLNMPAKYSVAVYTDQPKEISIPKDASVNLEVRVTGTASNKINISSYPAEKNSGEILITQIKNSPSSVGQVYPDFPLSINFDNTTQALRFHTFVDGVKLKVQCASGKCLADPQTTISSQSTASGIKRTLEAKVNRQSGLLQSLFDYTLFSRTNIE
ncbi:hypothetical protein CO101_02450 [Candidatus Berkelbacteria bacterium CG_4_9_14_3_um_filter_39_23]|uniref:Type 4 fimbrial biogenesis protein PilX N-terminal domain-containing protein n=2 Tax=Candidatus Berkelbacteria TaxID=1618330 RepID=A0A2M7CJ02_9BACT|nr:hypothetical protein [Candidatus Berkelbacteria bacterium]OIP05000.1 MAG: hypothetical protein AUK14_02285 [Candidatus Berkelbacteria bacterium CG2_30_39_44]PIR27844.1 MAG: hypothetical protein COV39_02280 [Candidatus Berkelbacteria bacterium CG11_big_fil_rev_8_21_14_0_20_40_23]PIV25616.1 MAG: hypothetical protein COS38_00690 [Candidatus Berkelbacteria bacterium CG03_land_8_20_14_0_80_40_36]PIX30662.1 MAG: hypothetical protein COZ62_01435 [Candidatus Berkelbacteria bacterium CG_4_8_14_3_um_f